VRQQLSIPRAAAVALHVGSGFERKGVRGMLEAVARAPSGPWAIVVGRDKRSARYAGLARSLGIAERVRFVGAVSDVRPYYAAADVFVLATLYGPAAKRRAGGDGLRAAGGHHAPLRRGRAGRRGPLGLRARRARRRRDRRRDRAPRPAAAREAGRRRAPREPFTPEAMAREYLALYERLLHR
jgi:UDP-glucose:(heptosyl)LPS alpha-1,3-glucosyltransferase